MIIPINNIRIRAERLNQPEMMRRYKELAITWDDENDICELLEEDWRELNTMWKETGRSTTSQPAVKQNRKPCKNCGGL